MTLIVTLAAGTRRTAPRVFLAASPEPVYNRPVDFDRLPGGPLIRQGLEDLAEGRDSNEALLVLVGSPRLKRLGLRVPREAPPFVEHVLYERLAQKDSDAAHSRYNALIRLLVSFERAAECAA